MTRNCKINYSFFCFIIIDSTNTFKENHIWFFKAKGCVCFTLKSSAGCCTKMPTQCYCFDCHLLAKKRHYLLSSSSSSSSRCRSKRGRRSEWFLPHLDSSHRSGNDLTHPKRMKVSIRSKARFVGTSTKSELCWFHQFSLQHWPTWWLLSTTVNFKKKKLFFNFLNCQKNIVYVFLIQLSCLLSLPLSDYGRQECKMDELLAASFKFLCKRQGFPVTRTDTVR